MSDRWKGLRRVFRLPLGRRGVEGEVVEELRFHLEERIEELVAQGFPREAAEREARSRLGDLRRLEGQLTRIDRRVAWRKARGEAGKAFWRELRFGVRGLRRHPGFATAVVLTLGIGMGATGAIYTLLRHVVLDPLPYPASERLVRLKNPVPGVEKGGEWNLSRAQFFYYRQHVPELESIGLYRLEGVNAAVSGEARRAHAAMVTASMLKLLGAKAIKGRLFGEPDDVPGAPAVAILSYGFWRSEFGADSGVVGKSVRLNDEPIAVVGVMASGVELPRDRGEAVATRADIWLPMRLSPAGPFYNEHVYPVIARLGPDATLARAEGRIARLRAELPQTFPNAYSEKFFERYRFHTVLYPLKQYVLGDLARNLWILFGAVGLVLLIACANVANLLFARLETRRREFAVRSALGAGRGQVAREAFAEGAVLALAGAAVAALVSAGSARWLVLLSPAGIPRLDAVTVDGQVLLFLLGIALAIAAGLALVPVLQYRGLAGLSALSEAGRGGGTAGVRRQRLRSSLVVVQVALALMLVAGSGLLLQSFRRLRAVDPGIDPQGVLTLDWFLPYQRYDSLSKVWRFHDEVLTKIRALPGVAAAGASGELPLLTGFGCTVQGFEEPVVYDRIKDAGLTTCAGQAPTTPGYFEALRIPLLAGRLFSDADNTAPERGAVIVTKAFAERFWPGENPLGKGVNPNGRSKPPFYHVVGLVGDLHGTALDEPPGIGIFYPIVAMPGGGGLNAREMHLVVRAARGDPLALLPAVRSAVNAVDPTIPIANAEPMSLVVSRSMGRLTFTMLLLGIAGAVALALAAIGLYGLLAYIVAQRRNEIGVRIALGARAGQVEGLVVGRALKLVGIGLLIGLA
ncbi:MAG TPA: ABC transporter permease, partial [Gemmatimonadales bacterium]|nr:ABC transporter permease [Gemmatimonadales bacterium]